MFGVGTTGTECFQVTIADDDQLEDSEGFQISILTTPRDPAVDVPEPVLPITILDDDGMCKYVVSNVHGNVITSFIYTGVSVLFTADSYTIGEEELTLNVCISLDGSTDVPISIILSLEEDEQVPIVMRATRKLLQITICLVKVLHAYYIVLFKILFKYYFCAVGMDFTSLGNAELTVASPQVPVCLSVNLLNDNIFEDRETFLLSMSTSRERVLVDDALQITIIDNDG